MPLADDSHSYPLFSVSTPTATITDLGTEFGVEVNGSESTAVQVFDGKVKMQAFGSNTKTSDSEIVLSENQSAYTKRNADRMVAISRGSFKALHFTKTLPTRETEKGQVDGYGAMVLEMQPTLYYRMELPEDGDARTLYDSAPGKHHGVIHFIQGYVDTVPYIKGRFGKSLLLRGPSFRDYAIVPDYPKTTDGRLSVSAWVMCMARGTPGVIVANWRQTTNHRNEGQFVLYTSQYSLHNFAGKGTDQDGAAAVAIETQSDGSEFPRATWQHIVQVFDGNTMHLYRNGVEVASTPCRGVHHSPPVQWLSIGCEEAAWTKEKLGFWQGRIDEIAIFNRALSADEIQQLYRGR